MSASGQTDLETIGTNPTIRVLRSMILLRSLIWPSRLLSSLVKTSAFSAELCGASNCKMWVLTKDGGVLIQRQGIWHTYSVNNSWLVRWLLLFWLLHSGRLKHISIQRRPVYSSIITATVCDCTLIQHRILLGDVINHSPTTSDPTPCFLTAIRSSSKLARIGTLPAP